MALDMHSVDIFEMSCLLWENETELKFHYVTTKYQNIDIS